MAYDFIPDNVSKYDNVFDVLQERGFIEQTTDDEGIRDLLGKEKVKFYIGFDATADCLHVGHFMQVIIMMYMQKFGHTPVVLIGGGTGMVDGFLDLIPNAKVGHIGLYRDPETHQPVEYYCKMPEALDKRKIFVTDPMLATGGSAVAAIDFIKARGGKDISFMCMIAAPEGIETLQKAHPDVDIYIAATDSCLNENAYIVPGLGDAGDRIFGTK